MIDILLYVAYGLGGVALIFAIITPFLYLRQSPKRVLESFIIFGVFAIVFLVCFLISSGEVLPIYHQFGVWKIQSKLIGASLMTLYFIGGLSILTLIFTEIYRAFK